MGFLLKIYMIKVGQTNIWVHPIPVEKVISFVINKFYGLFYVIVKNDLIHKR